MSSIRLLVAVQNFLPFFSTKYLVVRHTDEVKRKQKQQSKPLAGTNNNYKVFRYLSHNLSVFLNMRTNK